MKNIYYRLQQPSPRFFRQAAWGGFILALLSTAILLLPAIPAILILVASDLAVAGLVIIFMSALTVDTDAVFLNWIYGKTNDYIPRLIDPIQLK